MSLVPGTHVGPYKVVAVIGAGGMGEVYRATDTRLGRDVALKVLPDRFASDPDRHARFQREARLLASLNHPNIAAIHGVEDAALVLELVEGATLADRIARGPIPLAEALHIAEQITAALEAAHEQGIIHRDLKPANVKVTDRAMVKVLDFGLAKLVERTSQSSPDGSDPTETLSHMTGPGGVFGTAPYMSPEQARGQAVDRRADIWAFGCVVYEMLTGRRAFAGTTSAEVIGKVLEREPDLAALPATTPPSIRRLLRRCLVKDPNERLRDISDARLEIREAELPAADLPVVTRSRLDWRWLAAAALVAATASGVIAWRAARSDPAAPAVVRFAISNPPPASTGRYLAISPDGARLVYGTAQGFALRARDRLESTLLRGLGTFINAPFFSPDGEWVGYVDSPILKKVSVAGGTPVAVAEVGPGAVCDWAPEGIVCADVRGVFRVPSDGSPAVRLAVDVEAGEQATHPEILPGGRAVLYTVIPTRTIVVGGFEDASGARVDVLEIATGARKTLIRGASRARYVSTGHLVYAFGGTLHAVGFDPGTLALRGQPVEVVSEPGSTVFAVSDDGTLVYMSGTRGPVRTLVWVDRQRREESLGRPAASLHLPTPVAGWHARGHRRCRSARSRYLDVGRPQKDARTIHGRPRREIRSWPGVAMDAAWHSEATVSGRRISSSRPRTEAGSRSACCRATGSRCRSASRRMGVSCSRKRCPGMAATSMSLSLDGTRRVERLVHTTANDLTAEVSLDGKWIAYDSNESGQFEVYVRPYPNVNDNRWQISQGGGRQPLWSRDGRELFYRDFTGASDGRRR